MFQPLFQCLNADGVKRALMIESNWNRLSARLTGTRRHRQIHEFELHEDHPTQGPVASLRTPKPSYADFARVPVALDWSRRLCSENTFDQSSLFRHYPRLPPSPPT